MRENQFNLGYVRKTGSQSVSYWSTRPKWERRCLPQPTDERHVTVEGATYRGRRPACEAPRRQSSIRSQRKCVCPADICSKPYVCRLGATLNIELSCQKRVESARPFSMDRWQCVPRLEGRRLYFFPRARTRGLAPAAALRSRGCRQILRAVIAAKGAAGQPYIGVRPAFDA